MSQIIEKKQNKFFSQRLLQWALFFISFLIVGFAQPDWSPAACVLASSSGYALFWRGLLLIQSKKKRFLLATCWFASVMFLHLNWLLADLYVGFYIYPFLFMLIAGLGLQFGIITLLIENPKQM